MRHLASARREEAVHGVGQSVKYDRVKSTASGSVPRKTIIPT
jgi:hypothetical protein